MQKKHRRFFLLQSSGSLFFIPIYLVKVSLQRQILIDGKRPYDQILIVIGPFHKSVVKGRDGLNRHRVPIVHCYSAGVPVTPQNGVIHHA